MIIYSFPYFQILYVFINFQYDSMSMDLLLQEGLVGILINELKEFNSSDQEFYKKKREERLSSSNKRKAAKLAKDSRCKVCSVPVEEPLYTIL